jgi:tight adherence protein B
VTYAAPALVAAALLLIAAPALRRVMPRRAVITPPFEVFAASGVFRTLRGAGKPRKRPTAGRTWRRRRPRVADEDIAEWCEHAARRVRAGHSLVHAVVDAGTDAPAGAAVFRPVTHALRRGRSLTDALSDLTLDDGRGSAAGLVVPVLNACAELGGPAAMPLERVAATLHARAAERAERRANSAQARLSATVLSVVPIGVLALLTIAEPAVRSSLTTPIGVLFVVTGGLFNLAGWCWMRRLIGSSG